ncbi:MAG: transglycosylase SLT domain-containing protein [Gammaproteobacteria bacterium]|nr:transglycosylase SLT domain-containing protein [Gammaproteobacteria bacterium]
MLMLILGLSASRLLSASVDFPQPQQLAPAVDFWVGVYCEVDLDQTLLHDDRYLSVVYEVLDLKAAVSSAARRALVQAAQLRWREMLHSLSAEPDRDGADQRRAHAMLAHALGRPPRAADFAAAAERLRVQRGQRSRFIQGLQRAGRYEARIRDILTIHELPADLAYLPHVESAFDSRAYSKVGAAGMWQFIPSTGRRYLRVDEVVDERLDPFRAAEAAALLLKANHDALGSWPLALTAYNHGRAGMLRAREAVGSDDLALIIDRYQGRRFGFASRNFYAQFLAARRIAREYQAYVGRLHRARPLQVVEFELPFYVEAHALPDALGVAERTLRDLNLGLRPMVWKGQQRIPKGYMLRLPMNMNMTTSMTTNAAAGDHVASLLARIPAQARHTAQRARYRVHVVRRGESLNSVAARHNVDPASIVRLNKIRNANRIYPGQRLKLPAI